MARLPAPSNIDLATPASYPYFVAASRKTVLEAIILAFSHSRAKHMVGTDALRTVLEMESREIVRDGVVNLQPLWNLLESQPSFEAETCHAPIARIKQWEKQLGLDVVIPEQMSEIGPGEILELAEKCTVPVDELKAVLGGETVINEKVKQAERAKRATLDALAYMDDESPGPTATKLPSGLKKNLALGGAAVGVLGIIFAGWTLFSGLRGPVLDDVAVDFSIDIPLSKAQRNGAQVGGTLADPAWLALPAETQRKHLSEALDSLESQNVNTIFVRDERGNILASANRMGNRTNIELPEKK
jgi:hypothetical protein